MMKMKVFMNSEKGAALVEYGILVGLIAVLAIAAVLALGEQVRSVFEGVVTTLDSNLSTAGVDGFGLEAGLNSGGLEEGSLLPDGGSSGLLEPDLSGPPELGPVFF